MEESLTIDSVTYEAMIKAIAGRPPESGGVLGGTSRIVNRFYFDEFAQVDLNSYTPDIKTLNHVIESWRNEGLDFMGIVHSHDQHPRLLSTDDIAFAHSILQANADILPRVYFVLIICPFVSYSESFLSFVITPKKCCSTKTVIK